MIIDTETIFQLVNNKDWAKVIEIFKDNEAFSFIISDPILKQFVEKDFIGELLTNSTITNDPAYKYSLQYFDMLHTQTKFIFSLNKNDYKRLIVKIVNEENDLTKSYNYASKFPEDPVCKIVIEQYNAELPKVVSHSQRSEIYVTENKNIQITDSTISLFKSKQEYHFYKAVREIFQMYLVLPNVALNAILDFNSIKNKLSIDERKYFFSALVDCVVIDTENEYKPINFFELDSSYHDNEKQLNKDKLKDNILAKAGQRLIRIRRLTIKQDEKDFIKLIREVIH